MAARRLGVAVAGTTLAMAVAVILATSGHAETADPAKQARERPRGVVVNCSSINLNGSLRAFTYRRNLVVGPLVLRNAGVMLEYAPAPAGTRSSCSSGGGHRVTLELSRRTRRDVGLGFGPLPEGEVRLGDAHRVVTFIACRRGEYHFRPPLDGWPVSGWVGFLLASSPRCVPLFVWVDDEPRPRRAVIRFGVRDCG